MGEKRGMKALEVWCRRITDGYRDVRVDNMTTSWRDGLAFCALIHHFRPDLLDFDSLSKENIYENNNLAFTVAEQDLGIPALLEPEDMVKYAIPDRLSILTYVSQVYQYFASQDGSGKKMSPKKRPLGETTSPPETSTDKVASKVIAMDPVSPRTPESPKAHVPVRHDVCQACHNRVYILERLIVDNKLYHRTCFKCTKCQAVLSPGSYMEGEDSKYECVSCPDVEKEAERKRFTRAKKPVSPVPQPEQEPPRRPPVTYTPAKPFSEFLGSLTSESKETPVTDTGQFSLSSDDQSDTGDNGNEVESVLPEVPIIVTVVDTEVDEVSEEVVEVSEVEEVVTVNEESEAVSSVSEKEEGPPKPSRSPVPAPATSEYPEHLNPFEEDEVEVEPQEKVIGDWILRRPEHYVQNRRNPFLSASDEDLREGNDKPVPMPRRSVGNSKTLASPVRSHGKKSKAPAPPRPVTVVVLPSGMDRAPKPRPRSAFVAVVNPDDKSQKEMDNRNLKTPSDGSLAPVPSPVSSGSPGTPRSKNTFGQWKKKKPAPPVPLPPKRQIRKIPLKEIFVELEEIEEKQLELEKTGVDIEKSIRERFSNTSDPSTEEEDLILQLFELVNKKNGLFRRQAELIYMKRQQRLEEEHADLEFQIRCLMEKSEHKKTEVERIFEEQLIERLVRVVRQRNEIIESMEMDRLREREEDESIQEKMALHQSLGARRNSGGSGSSAASSSQSPASSDKSSKKDKKEKQVKGGNKKGGTNVDADKDIDESETLSQVKTKKERKKKWF